MAHRDNDGKSPLPLGEGWVRVLRAWQTSLSPWERVGVRVWERAGVRALSITRRIEIKCKINCSKYAKKRHPLGAKVQ
jgi:hypothetical protein